jgi:hypothetical protein
LARRPSKEIGHGAKRVEAVIRVQSRPRAEMVREEVRVQVAAVVIMPVGKRRTLRKRPRKMAGAENRMTIDQRSLKAGIYYSCV